MCNVPDVRRETLLLLAENEKSDLGYCILPESKVF